MYVAIHATLVYNIRVYAYYELVVLEYVRVCIVINNVCMNTLVLLLASMNTTRVEEYAARTRGISMHTKSST